jgi:flavin reductase (DIM6/NTAB) family NADH-FMN oxidoreductase RutF
VLTVVHGDQAHGSTASAVMAASNDPLLICICLRDGSTFAGLAALAGRFVVNVLSSRQAALADWFADPGRPSGYRQFAVVDWTVEPAFSAPLLGGAIAWLDCQLTHSYPAGDHRVLLAEVRGGASGAGTPLLSFDRQLHGIELRSVPRRDRGGSTGAGIVTLD